MAIDKKRRFQVFCIFLSGVLALLSTARAKPTLPFSFSQSFSSLPSFSSLTQQFVEKRQINQMKSYSGIRLSNDSLLMIYYHDQTVAVVELGSEKLLIGCELIEVYNDNEGKRLLSKLSTLNRPLEINFNEMLKLMRQCETIDAQKKRESRTNDDDDDDKDQVNNNDKNRGVVVFPRSPLSLFSGIIPGTKWCGTGDIATTYNDLGTEVVMDRCCRTHDLCPVKIRAYQNRYELNNESLYTKSHCICDDMLYSCLKKTNTSAAQLMGSIYFNLVQVPCLQQTKKGLQFRQAREGF